MVDEIRKLAAKLGNEEVFKWAIRNSFYFMEIFEDEDLFLDVAKKGHLRVLEIAHSNRLEWYSREMLEDAVARYDVQLLYFIFNKKPERVSLRHWSGGKMQNYLHFLLKLHIVDNGECWIVFMRMDINKHPMLQNKF
jgi:hypothetical protein